MHPDALTALGNCKRWTIRDHLGILCNPFCSLQGWDFPCCPIARFATGFTTVRILATQWLPELDVSRTRTLEKGWNTAGTCLQSVLGCYSGCTRLFASSLLWDMYWELLSIFSFVSCLFPTPFFCRLVSRPSRGCRIPYIDIINSR